MSRLDLVDFSELDDRIVTCLHIPLTAFSSAFSLNCLDTDSNVHHDGTGQQHTRVQCSCPIWFVRRPQKVVSCKQCHEMDLDEPQHW